MRIIITNQSLLRALLASKVFSDFKKVLMCHHFYKYCQFIKNLCTTVLEIHLNSFLIHFVQAAMFVTSYAGFNGQSFVIRYAHKDART